MLSHRRSVLLAGLLALSTFWVTPDASAQTKLTVAYSPSVDFVSVYVAKEKGYFAKRGLDVSLTPMLSSLIPTAIESGSAQIGMPSTPVALAAIDAGLDQVIVGGAAVTDTSMKDVGIVVRAGSAIKTPADLQGKKIGVPGVGALLHVLTRQWMILKGVDPGKVNFVEVALPQMNDVLRSGAIDAGVSVDPITSRITGSGTGVMLFPVFAELPNGISTVVFAASRSWASKNATSLAAFRDSIAEAIDYVATNPAEGQAMVGAFLKVSPEVLAVTRRPSMRLVLSNGQVSDWIDIMKRQDMIKAKLSASDYLPR